MDAQANDLTLAAVVVILGAVGTSASLLPHRLGTTQAPADASCRQEAGSPPCPLLLFALFWTPPGSFLVSVFFLSVQLHHPVGGRC